MRYTVDKHVLSDLFGEEFFIGEGHLFEDMYTLNKVEKCIILLCRKGWADVIIDFKQYRIEENMQVMLLPMTVVRAVTESPDFDMVFSVFGIQMIREAGIHIAPLLFKYIKDTPCRLIDKEDAAMLNVLNFSIKVIFSDKKNIYRTQIARNCLQNFLLAVYDKCLRLNLNKDLSRGSTKNNIFHNFMDILHDNSSGDRSVKSFANKLRISSKYLTDSCRMATGFSAKQIIDSFILLEIKVMLHSSEFTLQEIAFKFGFPDQSYFGRFFKRYEGVSPREFRRVHYLKA